MARRVILMAGTGKGVFFFESDEARSRWTLREPALPGWEVYSLLCDARDRPPRIYAGTSHMAYGAVLRVSDDLGRSWTQLEARPQYPKASGWEVKRIWQLAAGPEAGMVYAGVDEAGLFVSRDRGGSWQELSALTGHSSRSNWFPGAGGLCLHTVLVDRDDPRRLWVGISAVGVFRTTDAGASWTLCNKGLPVLPTGSDDASVACCVHKIVQDPARRDTLYMQYHGGVFRSTDGAESWQAIESGLSGNFGFPMVVSAAGELFVVPLHSDEQRFFRDGRFVVYRSRDRGETWQPLQQGLPQQAHYAGVLRDAMACDPLAPAGVYVGTTMGELYASNDAGSSWTRLPGTLPRIQAVKVAVLDG